MEQLITDRLRDNLTRLKPQPRLRVLQIIAEQAEADNARICLSWTSCWRRRWPVKEKRRFQTAMKTAGLPPPRASTNTTSASIPS